MSKRIVNTKFFEQVVDLLQESKDKVVRSVNHTMVLTYFEIGRLIVEEEQKGKERAGYGKELLKGLSEILSKEFGRGFSVTNLSQMRSFYTIFQIRQTASDEFDSADKQYIESDGIRQTQSDEFNLSWSHYLTLMRIDDENERKFYEIEAFNNNWSVRELQRQYDSAFCLLNEALCDLCVEPSRPLRLNKSYDKSILN